MSRFLFVMFEGGGNVPPQLGIARRLVRAGHAVRVLGDPALEKSAAAAGCEFVPFRSAPHHNMRDPAADRLKDWSSVNPLRQLALVADELMFGPAAAYARDVVAETESFCPHALAVDCLLFGALVGAEKSGLPTAALVHMPYVLPTDGVPPYGFGLRPARGIFGRQRERVLRALLSHIMNKLGRRSLDAARASLGLSPLACVFDQLLRADRILVLSAQSYDFAARAALPSHVVYVGPELDDPSWTDPWTSPWNDTALPLVVVTLGSTFQNQHAVTQRIIDALGSLRVRGLVTLGGVFAPADFRLPVNVVAVPSAPHRAVFPQARVVVAHGGHGTTMKALAHGVPVLSVPLGRDQADNAARVVECGAGLRIASTARVRTIAGAVQRLLDDPTFAVAARRLAAEIARDVSADRATRELEMLAEVTTNSGGTSDDKEQSVSDRAPDLGMPGLSRMPAPE